MMLPDAANRNDFERGRLERGLGRKDSIKRRLAFESGTTCLQRELGRCARRLAGYLEEDNDLLARLAPESVAISLHWFVASRASRRCH